MKGDKGFLVLEVLIACLILTSAVAASMYLFRTGFEHLDRASASNAISAKLPQAISLMRTRDLTQKRSGIEDMGDDVTLEWTAKLADSSTVGAGGYRFFLYSIQMKLVYKKTSREYDLNVLRNSFFGEKEDFATD